MARSLLLALALALVAAPSLVSAVTKTVQWSFSSGKPPKYADLKINLGDKVTFTWSETKLLHDVVQLPGLNAYTSCAIKEANIGRITDLVLSKTVTITPFAGTWYYTCTAPNHCGAGQKIKIIVKNAKPLKPSPTVKWILPGVSGTPFKDIKIKQGQTVTFSWSGAVAHDVWTMSGKANYDSCSFKKAVPVSPVPAVKTGAVKVTPPKGTYYFSCSVIGHCGKTGKQKVKMIVS